MLQAFQRLLNLLPPRSDGGDQGELGERRGAVVLYTRLGAATEPPVRPARRAGSSDRRPAEGPGTGPTAAEQHQTERPEPEASETEHPEPTAAPAAMRPRSSHRRRLLGTRLYYLRIFSSRRCQQLASIGITTAGELLSCDPADTAHRLGASPAAKRALTRSRHAIRFAAAVPGMMPRDALLLIRVHRRGTRRLATESPASLRRDLERFALSSRGQRLLRGRPVPTIDQLRGWIDACARSRRPSQQNATAPINTAA